MAIDHVLHQYVGVQCTHYLDDFTVIVPEQAAKAVTDLTEKLLELLGWDIKKSKEKPMDKSFVALGVNFDLGPGPGPREGPEYRRLEQEGTDQGHRRQDPRAPSPRRNLCGRGGRAAREAGLLELANLRPHVRPGVPLPRPSGIAPE